VEYNVHSYIDTEELKPLRFYKKRFLRGITTEETINFDYKNKRMKWEYSKPFITKELPIPENIQDLLSSLYFFRRKDIQMHKSYPLNIVYNGDFWPVNVTLDETVDIEVSRSRYFHCAISGISSNLNQKITGFNNFKAYFSLDKKRLPVLFRMRTRIGSLSGVLQE
ncbi:MAG: DUF3108 domain-containing protein, partial [Candidatus Omnitrophica bacterium]|nr:DUF3108 domain-containing protein [Candidatus Omnitrophota bacterium]